MKRDTILEAYPSVSTSLLPRVFDEALIGIGHRRDTCTSVYSLRVLRNLDPGLQSVIDNLLATRGQQPLVLYSGGVNTWPTIRRLRLPIYESMNYATVGVCLKLLQPKCIAYSMELLKKELALSYHDSRLNHGFEDRVDLLKKTNMGESTPCIIETIK
jgi:hypothetical protein